MRKHIFATIILTAATLMPAQAQRLVILHTNDTHSQILPDRLNGNIGGVERRMQYYNSIVSQYGKKNVLILDAGDYNQGTPYYTMGHGLLERDLMNALGVDVTALGNHEFDDGMADLASRLKKARYKVLACNYDFSATPLRRIVKPYAIVRKGGMKIGIIGATSYLEGKVLKENVIGTVRLNTVKEVNRWAAFLREKKHCDMVILLSHLGFENPEDCFDIPSDVIMAENSRNLDFIIGGHSHTFMEKPYVVKDLDGKEIPIVQDGCRGYFAGRLDIE